MTSCGIYAQKTRGVRVVVRDGKGRLIEGINRCLELQGADVQEVVKIFEGLKLVCERE